MSGLIIGGKEYNPGFFVVNYKDRPKVAIHWPEDMRRRVTKWIRNMVWHNTRNIATKLMPGIGKDTKLEDRIAEWWSLSKEQVGAHGCVDWDTTVGQHADLLLYAAFHAGSINEVSTGWELFENNSGHIYEAQIEMAVRLTDFITMFFGIQRQIPTPEYYNKVISRAERGGKDLVGVFGHCNQYAGKPNDPGVHIFQALKKAGYREFDFEHGEDIAWWKSWQEKCPAYPGKPDGIPGPMTVDALQARGYEGGIWLPPEHPRG